MPRFRLVSPDCDDLGSFMAARPDWSPGDVIPRGPGDHLRVLGTSTSTATRTT
jgi:hypothetical protein